MEFTNAQVAKRLREVAAAYAIKGGNLFQIRAYENAADAIEHSTTEIKDLWEQGQLDQVPGIGESLKNHLEEFFKTGKVKHWDDLKKNIPTQVFDFLDIPGVGPKTAYKLADLGVKSIEDLSSKIKSGELVKKGFSAKIAEKIMVGIEELASIKSGRMLLPYAYNQAEQVISYLRKNSDIERADALGSLRRMVATVGDLDFAIASKESEKIIDYIISMPNVARVIDKGEKKATIMLTNGLHLDFLVVDPSSYGALLQHFTGSKAHNIHLRTLAEDKGYSLSEYGVKDTKTGKIIHTKTEDEFYKLLGMQTPPPEIREDTGEIEAALKHNLPKLVELKDIKGDLHTHSNIPLEPSHGPGARSIDEMVQVAKELGYSYLGIADHPPSFTGHTKQQIISLIERRSRMIEQYNYSNKKIRVLNLLEIDILPDGSLSVPDEALKTLDFALAGVHSAHRLDKDTMTKRILKALTNPYVKVLTHPTGRILNERSSYDADWDEIFKFAAKYKKAMEINGYPNRLDLPESLIRKAKAYQVKFVINTDSHDTTHLYNMRFGVAVARRGWCTEPDIINSWDWKKLKEWFSVT